MRNCSFFIFCVLVFFQVSTGLGIQPGGDGNIVKMHSTERICQLTGDWDRERNQPTQNYTDTRHGLYATDLGVPFMHDGKIFVIFGDTWGTWEGDRDAWASTSDFNPEDGIQLDFFVNLQNQWRPIATYDEWGNPMSQGGFEVPIEAVSANGTIYLYHSWGVMVSNYMSKRIGTSSSFTRMYDLSALHFINVAIVEAEASDWSGLPYSGQPVFIHFGSGAYRVSAIRLAVQPKAGIEQKSTIRYFTGLNAQGAPQWSSIEADAQPLFPNNQVGELSASYNTYLKKWLLTYNCGNPRGINLRWADQPWGPWSEPMVIFNPWTDGGYCHFMHMDWTYQNCDAVHDSWRPNESGGEYGPYQFDMLAKGPAGQSTIYYTMSTWNPYAVMLMKTGLKKVNFVSVQPTPIWGGTTVPGSGEQTIDNMSFIPLRATAAAGYQFDHWEGPVGNPAQSNTTLLVEHDGVISAHFKPDGAINTNLLITRLEHNDPPDGTAILVIDVLCRSNNEYGYPIKHLTGSFKLDEYLAPFVKSVSFDSPFFNAAQYQNDFLNEPIHLGSFQKRIKYSFTHQAGDFQYLGQNEQTVLRVTIRYDEQETASQLLWNNPSDFLVYEAADFDITGTEETPLPKVIMSPYLEVELISFSHQIQANGILLNWQVASDDRLGFRVERKGRDAVWRSIQGQLLAASAREYLDPAATRDAALRYRLISLERDGAELVLGELEVFSSAPAGFGLAQNYPNPFNSRSTIRYQISEPSMVEIQIYDSRGTEKAVLVHQQLSAGPYSVEWDALDWPSGLYIIRMQAGAFAEVRKAVLLK